MGQPVIEATLFSRISKSLRSTFDLSSSRMWFRSPLCSFRSPPCSSRIPLCSFRVPLIDLISSLWPLSICLISWISSVFLPTCSNVASNLDLMLGISSRIGLKSDRMASISAPTSVTVNLPFFLVRFSTANIVIERHFSVKQNLGKLMGAGLPSVSVIEE